MRVPKRVEQALHQRDVPVQAGLLRVVIEIDRDGLLRRRLHDGVDIGDQAVVRHALVVERRQHQRAGKAELGGIARQRHRVGDGRGAGADHHAVERQAGRLVGVHHALALLERERGRLAGGAEHVEPVAAVVDQVSRELGGARGVGRAVLVDRGGDGGDHAFELGGRHGVSWRFLEASSRSRRLSAGIKQDGHDRDKPRKRTGRSANRIASKAGRRGASLSHGRRRAHS